MIFYIKNSKNAHSRAKHVKNAFLYEILILSVKRLQTRFQRKKTTFWEHVISTLTLWFAKLRTPIHSLKERKKWRSKKLK